MKFYWLVTEKTQVTDGRKDGRKDGRTDGRKDGRTDNAILISPSLFHRRGIIRYNRNEIGDFLRNYE